MLAENGAPYMTRYGSITLKELIKKCKAKGLKVGVYDNPLWIHGDDSVHVRGTKDVTIGDLRYRSSDKVLHKTQQIAGFRGSLLRVREPKPIS